MHCSSLCSVVLALFVASQRRLALCHRASAFAVHVLSPPCRLASRYRQLSLSLLSSLLPLLADAAVILPLLSIVVVAVLCFMRVFVQVPLRKLDLALCWTVRSRPALRPSLQQLLWQLLWQRFVVAFVVHDSFIVGCVVVGMVNSYRHSSVISNMSNTSLS